MKKHTVRLKKRKGLYGNKKKTDPNVNEYVNSVYINNFGVNKDLNMDNTVVNNVDHAATASEKKVEMISISAPSKNSSDVNTRIAYTMRACGQRYAGLEKFSSLMNFPMPMTTNMTR